MAEPFQAAEGGALLFVKVRPNASADRIETVSEGADGRPRLSVRVRAAPRDGAANTAVCALVAKRLRLAKSAVGVQAGGGGREKTLRLAAPDPGGLLDALRALVHEAGS